MLKFQSIKILFLLKFGFLKLPQSKKYSSNNQMIFIYSKDAKFNLSFIQCLTF
jgi:hypothetical protein